MPEVDPVILQLRADTGDYENRVKSAASVSEQSLGKIQASSAKTEAAVTKHAGAIAAAEARLGKSTKDAAAEAGKAEKEWVRASVGLKRMEEASKTSSTALAKTGDSAKQAAYRSRLLGYQISDIGTQLSSGTNPFIILAQQGPQVANALDGAGGAVGRLATFLSGPLGAALFFIIPLVGQLIARNIDLGKGTEDLVKGLKDQADKTKEAASAQQTFEVSIEGVTKALHDNQKALEALDQAKQTDVEKTYDQIKANYEHAVTIRDITVANLQAAKSDLERKKAAQEQSLFLGNQEQQQAAAQEALAAAQAVDAADKKLEAAKSALEVSRQQLELAKSNVRVQDALASREDQITKKYAEQIDNAKNLNAVFSAAFDPQSQAYKKLQQQLDDQIKSLKKARDLEIERARAAENAAKSSGATGITSFTNPVSGPISSGFGVQRPGHKHAGIDIAVPVGTPVRAAAAGTIIEVGTLPGYGNVMIIDHGSGTTTRYAHLSKFLGSTGTQVSQGQVIALSGGARGAAGAGDSTGPHLHYEVRRGGKAVDPTTGAFAVDAVKSAEIAQRAADQEAQRRQRFNDQLAQLQGKELDARQALVTDAGQMAQFALDGIEIERKRRDDAYETAVQTGKLHRDEADKLIAINDATAELLKARVQQVEDERKFRENEQQIKASLHYQSAVRADQADVLQGQENIARTLTERNDIERQLVDLKYQEEKAQNDALIAYAERLRLMGQATAAEQQIADAAAAEARVRNASIGQRQANAQVAVSRNTPLGSYIDQIGDVRTRVETATVRELQAVNQGITDALAEQLGIKNQFVKELFSIFLDEVIFRPLAEALRGLGGGGGLFGSLFGGIFGGGGGLGRLVSSAAATIGNPAYAGIFGDGGVIPVGSFGTVGDAGIETVHSTPRGAVVIPSKQSIAARPGGHGGGGTQIYVDARGAVMNQEFASQILDKAKGYAAEAGARAVGEIDRRAPTAVRNAQRYGRG